VSEATLTDYSESEQKKIIRIRDAFLRFAKVFANDSSKREEEEEIQRMEAGEQYKRELQERLKKTVR
jgi:hypothetical protein